MTIIDVHTHAFPDAVAPKAMPRLEESSGVRAVGDGTVASLVASMAASGVSGSVVASIATRPEQSAKITAWSAEVRQRHPSVIPFGSVHPDGDWSKDLAAVKAAGLAGVKFHPYYQDFTVDDDRMLEIYERVRDLGLIALFHAGYDVGYERYDCANPKRFLAVWNRVHGLRAVLAHLGGWHVWDQVLEHLPATGFYIDTSYCDGFIAPGTLSDLLKAWHPDRVLFGSDYPWTDQAGAVGRVGAWGLPPRETEKILGLNFLELLRGTGVLWTPPARATGA
jgi:predicted TIM-barrel fold metal-dependent hydrolase